MFKGLTYFLKFSLHNKKQYLISRTLIEVVKIIMTLTQIVLPKYILDELFGKQRMSTIFLYLGIFLGVSLIGSLSQSILRKSADNSLEIIRSKFECHMMENQMHCDFVQLELPEYHDLKTRANQYVNGPWNQFGYVCEKTYTLIGDACMLIGIISIVAMLNVGVLLMFLLLATINTWIGAYLTKKRMVLIGGFAPILRRRGYYEDITKNPQYAKEIRLGGISEWLIDRYNHYMELFCKKTVPIHRHVLIQKSVVVLTSFVGEGVTYGYLIWEVMANSITLGVFTMYLNAVNTFRDIINRTIDTSLELKKYTAFYQDFDKLNHLDRTIDTGTEEFGSAPYEIEFENVSFRYPGQEKYALKNVSVKIPYGKKISIVGENGAGKTTFIRLLTRLYEPSEGRILLNGIDIRQLNSELYRDLYGVVFQDYKLFQMTIRNNIQLNHDKDVKNDRMDAVVRITGLSQLIDKSKNGLDTQVYKEFDQEGIELSGGEGQKLALCRAYYKNNAIMILDEPTAALDPQSECEIYENFEELVKEKTAFFISHRLASSRVCDKIIVFHNGEIVEVGSHKELIELHGLYSELFSMQSLYFKNT